MMGNLGEKDLRSALVLPPGSKQGSLQRQTRLFRAFSSHVLKSFRVRNCSLLG